MLPPPAATVARRAGPPPHGRPGAGPAGAAGRRRRARRRSRRSRGRRRRAGAARRARPASAAPSARAVRSLRASAPAGSAVQGIAGGLHVLVDALVADLEAHGGTVRTGCDRGVPGRRRADRWVLATPSAVDLLGLTVGRPDPGAQVTLVTLVLDAPALDAAPRGTGVLVARGGHGRHREGAHARDGQVGRGSRGPPGRAATWCGCRTGGRARTRHAATSTRGPARRVRPARHAAVAASSSRGHAIVRWTQALPRPSAAHARVRRRCAGSGRAARAGSPCAGRGWPATGWRPWSPTRGRRPGRCSERNSSCIF